MMKKLAILLTLVMAVVLLFAACGENKPPVHEHDYGTLIAEVPATCTTAGTKAHYHCSGCNKDFDSNKNEITDLAIPATGHTEVTDEAVAATCTEAGKTAGKHCSVCGEVITAQEVVPATGHTEVTDEAVAATCTENGKTAGSHCSVCGEVIVAQEDVPATGHTYEWVEGTPAEFGKAGTLEHYHCDACGKDFDAEYNELTSLVIPPLDHDYVWIEEISAKCEEDGVSGHYYCSDCGKFFNEEFEEIEEASLTIPATGHTEGEWIIDKEATCTEDGNKHKECTACGETLVTEVIPATGHTEKWVIDEEATCTEDGKRHQICEVCGETLVSEEVIPASHTFGEWIEATEATCDEDGVAGHYHCSVCEKDFDADGNEISDLVIPATGHRLGGWVAGRDSAPGQDGILGHRECEICGKNFDMWGNEIATVVIHDYEVLGGYRTISEDGISQDAPIQKHLHCMNCDKLFNLDYEEISEEDLQTETRIAITSNEEMQYFADLVNAGNSFAGESFILLADVELNTYIGSVEDGRKAFSGSFDGQGHTVTITQSFENQDAIGGLFSFVRVPVDSSITIQNVKVAGTIKLKSIDYNGGSNHDHASTFGGLIAAVDAGGSGDGGELNIINCLSSVCIETDETGGRVNQIGGFIGMIRHEDGYTKPLTINFTSCVWDGVIDGKSAIDMVGGFIGYTGQNKNERTITVNIKNSVSAGTINMNVGWSGDSGVCLVVGTQTGNYSTQTGVTTINIENMIVCGKMTSSASSLSKKYGLFRKTGEYSVLNLRNFYYVEASVKNIAPIPVLCDGVNPTRAENVVTGNIANILSLTNSAFSEADQWVFPGELSYPCPATIKSTFGLPTSMTVDPDEYAYLVNSEIEIGTDKAMEAFAASVNSGKTYEGKTVKLTADVNLNTNIGYTGSSNDRKWFSGSFDGQGHTVTITQSFSNPDGDGGLFSMVRIPENGTIYIKNVHVTGTISLTNTSTGTGYVGGLISAVDAGKSGNGGTINIENVWNTVRINGGTSNAWNSLGGFIGFVRHEDGLKQITINIDSCLWDGIINSGPAIYHAGGFIGYTGNNKADRQPLINITNSVAAGKFSANIDGWNQQFGVIASYLKGSYSDSDTAKVTVNIQNVISLTKATFAKATGSGSKIGLIEEVDGTTELNLSNIYYTTFSRPGVSGDFPVLAAGKLNTSTNVEEKTALEILSLTAGEFSNADKWAITGGINYPCPAGIYNLFGQPESLQADPYDIFNEIEIGTKEEFLAFRDKVNNGNSMAGKTVKLTADIDLEGEEWVSIGVPGSTKSANCKSFCGTFDGNGHTISNMTTFLEPTSGYVDMQGGLFSSLGDGAVVKNFTLTGTYEVHNISTSTGTTDYFGSVANAVKGTVLIQNVKSSVNFNMSVSKNSNNAWPGAVERVGGIVGFIYHDCSANLTIDGCEYSGTINTGNQAIDYAGIMAHTGNNSNGSTKVVTITNCAFTGKMTLNENSSYAMQGVAGIISHVTGNATVTITNTHSDGRIYFNGTKNWPIVDGDSNPIKMGQILGYNEDGTTVNIDSTVTYKPTKLKQDKDNDESIYILPEAGRLNGVYMADTDAVEIIEEEVEEVE